MAFMPGDEVAGRYRLELPLGERRSGALWRAEDTREQVAVALAIVEPRRSEGDDRVPSFLERMKALGEIQHENVARVLDSGELDGGRGYAALEWLDGETLADRLADGPALTVSEFVDVAAGALDGLAALHEAGIVHGDVEPSNLLLVDAEGRPAAKLIGIGYSRAAAKGARETMDPEDDGLLRSLAYTSPEQARGVPDIDEKTDIFSFGVLMYEALTGRLPHRGATEADIREAVADGDAPTLYSMRDDLPVSLTRVVQRAMAPKATARHASAAKMRQALQSSIRMAPDAVRNSPLPVGPRGRHRPSKAAPPPPPFDEEVDASEGPVLVETPAPKGPSSQRRAIKQTLVGVPDRPIVGKGRPAVPPPGQSADRPEGAGEDAEEEPAEEPRETPEEPKETAEEPKETAPEEPEEAAAEEPKETAEDAKAPEKVPLAAKKPEIRPFTVSKPEKRPFKAPRPETNPEAAKKPEERKPLGARQPLGAKKPSAAGKLGSGSLVRPMGPDAWRKKQPGKAPEPSPVSSAPERSEGPIVREPTEDLDGASFDAMVESVMDEAPDAPMAAPGEEKPPSTAESVTVEQEVGPTGDDAVDRWTGPARLDRDAEFEPFEPPPEEASTRRFPVLWVALGGLAVLVGIGVVLVATWGSGSGEGAGSGDELATARVEPGGEVGSTEDAGGALAAGDAGGTPEASAGGSGGSGESPGPTEVDGVDGGAASEDAAASDAALEGAEDAGPRTVVVSLRGVPEGAQVRLDGEQVDGPAVQVPADGRRHTLVVWADGYRPFRQQLSPDEDTEVEVVLRRRARGGTGPGKRPGLVRDPGF